MHFPATDPQCRRRPIALTNFRTERDVAQSLTQKSPGTSLPSLRLRSAADRMPFIRSKNESEFGFGFVMLKLQCIAMFMPNKVLEYCLSNHAVKDQ